MMNRFNYTYWKNTKSNAIYRFQIGTRPTDLTEWVRLSPYDYEVKTQTYLRTFLTRR